MYDKKFWGGFLLIFVLTIIVYYPSLEHVLRGETYTYFLDTQGHNSAWDLITGWYNYEKVRIYAPGDRWLFKPLLFSIDGLQKAWFGNNYLYWRISALSMHLTACFCMYRLLWGIKRGFIAVAVSLFFALMYVCLNAVLYEQIASYTLFTALILTAFYYVYTKKHLWVAILCLFIAPYINETGIIIAMVFCAYFWLYEKIWAIACTALIPIYFTGYFIEKLVDPAYGISAEFNKLVTWETIEYGLYAVRLVIQEWGSQIILPSLWALIPQYQLSSYAVVLEPSVASTLTLNVGALVGIAICIVMGRKRPIKKFALLVGVVALIFIVVVSVFRAKTHGTGYVVKNSFNAYMFLAWVVVLLYSILATFRLNANLLAGAFLILAVISGGMVYSANNDIKQAETPIRDYFAQLDGFILEHPNETFSSTVADVKLEERLKISLWSYTNPPETENHTYTVPEILYYEHWSDNPDYVLTYANGLLQ